MKLLIDSNEYMTMDYLFKKSFFMEKYKNIIYKILKDQKVNLKNIHSKELLEYMKNNWYTDWAYDYVSSYFEEIWLI